jgi:hypothetical protein
MMSTHSVLDDKMHQSMLAKELDEDSSFDADMGGRFWVFTEADRKAHDAAWSTWQQLPLPWPARHHLYGDLCRLLDGRQNAR